MLYWMQSSARAENNHALEYAVREAGRYGVALEVVFVFTDRFLNAPLRHYWFLWQGVRSAVARLSERGIPTTIAVGDPPTMIADLARHATTLVLDRGYLRIQRDWYERVVATTRCRVVQVESNIVVPVETASQKEEYAAATIRPKINRQRAAFMELPLRERYEPRRRPAALVEALARVAVSVDELDSPVALARRLGLSERVGACTDRDGSREAAEHALERFVTERFDSYHLARNDPSLDAGSHLSAYLHYGVLSPVEIALRAQAALREAAGTPAEEQRRAASEAFLEEMVVRRELAINFVHFNERYDSIESLPAWAQSTLLEHAADPRDYTYSYGELEDARTHDIYWNACQRQMVDSGSMHGYMRMYWGKKLLEWHADPAEAYAVALKLNDTYQLDGRDANGYAGVAWCFGKHDRPWARRSVFGTVRYMNAGGLRRKFKMEPYLQRWAG